MLYAFSYSLSFKNRKRPGEHTCGDAQTGENFANYLTQSMTPAAFLQMLTSCKSSC